MTEIKFELDGSVVNGLLEDLLKHLPDAPLKVRELTLNLLNGSGELFCIEQSVAAGAVVTLLLKPTQRLLDFCVALRTGNFDLLAIEDSHG